MNEVKKWFYEIRWRGSENSKAYFDDRAPDRSAACRYQNGYPTKTVGLRFHDRKRVGLVSAGKAREDPYDH
jgi:hypothetical protein